MMGGSNDRSHASGIDANGKTTGRGGGHTHGHGHGHNAGGHPAAGHGGHLDGQWHGDAVHDHEHHAGPIKRLIQLTWPDRGDFLIVLVFAFAIGFLSLATPVAVQTLVNFVAFGGSTQPVVVIGLLLLSLLLFVGAMRAVKTVVVEMVQRRVFVRVVGEMAHRLPHVSIHAYDRGHGPELVNRFFDVFTVQKVGATLMLDTVGVLLQAGVGLLVLAFYHPWLLWFDLVLVAALAFVIWILGIGAIRTAIEESRAKYEVAGSLEEIARNPLAFRIGGAPRLARLRSDELASEYIRCRKKHFAVVLRQVVGFVLLQALASTALLTLGGTLVIRGELTLGQLVAAELIVATVLTSAAKLGKTLESVYDLLAASNKLGHLLDVPLERMDGGALRRAPGAATIEFRNITFGHRPNHPLIRDFTLRLAPREVVLVVGRQGSGKSTLADLAIGLREPQSGVVLFDDLDLRELHLDSLREDIGILQGIEIIEGSLAENVALRRQSVSDEDVRAALAIVGLLDDALGLPRGLQTRLNSLGGPLSYGQARQLMLARAIAGRPRLLILDDGLNDLDPQVRPRVWSALTGPDVPWTLLALVRDPLDAGPADRVIYMPGTPQLDGPPLLPREVGAAGRG